MTTPSDPYRRPDPTPADAESQSGHEQYGQAPYGQAPYGQAPYGQAPYGQAPYGQPPYGGPAWGQPVGPRRNGLGVAALVLGIIGILLCWTAVGGLVAGGLAVGLGIAGRRRASRGEADNGGVALAGLITGAVAATLGLLFLVVFGALFSNETGRDYVECLISAGNDDAAMRECEREFEENF